MAIGTKRGSNIKDFDQILSEAIDDVIEHGFDTAERLAFWQEQLRRAAQAALMPQSEMERLLNEALTGAYRREIEKGGIIKRHPGVSRFTLDKVRPALRGELSKRIRASADLIKLDREKVINETIQRFSGWTTSVPAGGSKAQNRKEEKDNVRKGMAGLQFKERRVLIDQTHKLNAAISNVVATGGGAIAVIWMSHYHQEGYDYREEHKQREIESKEKPYLIKDSWAAEQGLVKLDGGKWLDNMTTFGEEIFCRCYGKYIYNLSALPSSMLTVKGKERLEEARRKMK